MWPLLPSNDWPHMVMIGHTDWYWMRSALLSLEALLQELSFSDQ